jgi:hypothetical protein
LRRPPSGSCPSRSPRAGMAPALTSGPSSGREDALHPLRGEQDDQPFPHRLLSSVFHDSVRPARVILLFASLHPSESVRPARFFCSRDVPTACSCFDLYGQVHCFDLKVRTSFLAPCVLFCFFTIDLSNRFLGPLQHIGH